MRYTLENQGSNYLCTDHESGLYVIFEARKFNETQDVNVPEGMTPDEALRAVVEMSDWLSIFHYSLVMPERATARQMIAHQLFDYLQKSDIVKLIFKKNNDMPRTSEKIIVANTPYDRRVKLTFSQREEIREIREKMERHMQALYLMPK